ncbi:MAG: indole-3-glycerol phosphate synthase TrpC [Pseudomonadota bacterium]
MDSILDEICASRRVAIDQRKAVAPLDSLIKQIPQTPCRGFEKSIRSTISQGGFALIAELKKASPSKGLIRPVFEPAKLASAYAKGGATCLSVLTEEQYFQGSDRYLSEARSAVPLPCLRKDFMLDPYQVYEARVIGADCILLIMAALENSQADELLGVANELGLDTLVEVHDEQELERALRLDARLIGVNNRNLKTLTVDLATTERLAPLIPKDRLLVAESGLYEHRDLERLAAVGARCFLVGESLMRQADVTEATARLLGRVGVS